ncbi:MAG: hypothetical protein KDJ88_21140 [Bauldia sp.]|nr:hypothetical protein [Bauldia sp.]
MLRFLVEEALAGRGDRLKGYTVGVAVFGREEGYDPQHDPIVRLEAHRLRQDLANYYVDAGSDDPIRISIPKGGYVPFFEPGRTLEPFVHPAEGPPDAHLLPDTAEADGAGPATRGPSRLRRWHYAAIAVVALLAAGAIWMATRPARDPTADAPQGPAVVVLPFEPLSPDPETRYLASGLTTELIDNLMRFPSFRLYTLPPNFGVDSGKAPGALGRELGVAYVVSGSVAASAGQISVGAQLLNADTGSVVWSKAFDKPLAPDGLFQIRRALAGEIASELGQPYGAVYTDLEARQEAPKVANMESYLCVLRAFDYRRSTFSRAKYAPVVGCLEAAVRNDPQYPDAWAMLGWLYMDGGRFEYDTQNGLDEQYAKALKAADHAIALDPDSILAISALSAIKYYMGQYEESIRLARRALELNSYDSDLIAQLGWRLSARGNFAEGVPLLERAIARTAAPPTWYYPLVAINDYLHGDYEGMLTLAQKFSTTSDTNWALVAIAYAELGNADAARAALAKINPQGLLARDPASFFRRHGATDEITNAMVAALDKARTFVAEN